MVERVATSSTDERLTALTDAVAEANRRIAALEDRMNGCYRDLAGTAARVGALEAGAEPKAS